jgi:hypothetical protein
MSRKTVEVIQVREHGEEHYYRKPISNQYQFYPTATIPAKLLDTYAKHRSMMLDYRKRIREYFQPTKDKPITIGKNVVREGDIIKFD